MDFTNRSAAHNQTVRPTVSVQPETSPHTTTSVPPAHKPGNKPSDSKKQLNILGISSIVLVFAVVGILLALIGLLSNSNKNANPELNYANGEAKYVNTSKYQAIFLNNGQVYFGNVKAINSQFINLQNIFYLQTASTTERAEDANVSLVKLGCELHTPYDQMIINRSQVNFWENIKEDSQVVQTINDYKDKNPNNTCETQSGTTTQSNTTPETTKKP